MTDTPREAAAPRFVVRSMSTSDWRPGVPVVPYHVFLLPIGKRHGAWWSTMEGHAMRFESEDEALAEVRRAKLDNVQIAPVGADALGLAPFWAEGAATIRRLEAEPHRDQPGDDGPL